MMIDNAFTNDGAISYWSKVVNYWNGVILGGQNIHLSCNAHRLNLIVAEGLKEYRKSIAKIRNVVGFVRSSPSRTQSICRARENFFK